MVLDGRFINQNIIHSSVIDGLIEFGVSASELESFINLKLAFDDDAWRNGVAFISEKHFTEFAKEMAEHYYQADITIWPCSCVDWDKAAKELKCSYTKCEICGDTYYGDDSGQVARMEFHRKQEY